MQLGDTGTFIDRYINGCERRKITGEVIKLLNFNDNKFAIIKNGIKFHMIHYLPDKPVLAELVTPVTQKRFKPLIRRFARASSGQGRA